MCKYCCVLNTITEQENHRTTKISKGNKIKIFLSTIFLGKQGIQRKSHAMHAKHLDKRKIYKRHKNFRAHRHNTGEKVFTSHL